MHQHLPMCNSQSLKLYYKRLPWNAHNNKQCRIHISHIMSNKSRPLLSTCWFPTRNELVNQVWQNTDFYIIKEVEYICCEFLLRSIFTLVVYLPNTSRWSRVLVLRHDARTKQSIRYMTHYLFYQISPCIVSDPPCFDMIEI